MLKAKLCPALSFRKTARPNHIELYRSLDKESRTAGSGSKLRHGKNSCSGMQLMIRSNSQFVPLAQPMCQFERPRATDVTRWPVTSFAFGGKESTILSKKT